MSKPKNLLELWKCVPDNLKEEIIEFYNFGDCITYPQDFLKNPENILKYPENSKEYKLILYFLIKFACSPPFEQFEFIVREVHKDTNVISMLDDFNKSIK